MERWKFECIFGHWIRTSRSIATVLNDLLARVEQEALTLESPVEERTRELRSAWETAHAAERYKSVFMSAVTHEMRTPLHVISAHASDVLGELECIPDATASRNYIQVILKNSTELLSRLNQILETRASRSDHRRNSATSCGSEQLRGFGLGLAIVARLTELLRGTVNLTSDVGSGTSVVVRLPVDVQLNGREKMDVIASNSEGHSG